MSYRVARRSEKPLGRLRTACAKSILSSLSNQVSFEDETCFKGGRMKYPRSNGSIKSMITHIPKTNLEEVVRLVGKFILLRNSKFHIKSHNSFIFGSLFVLDIY